MMVIIVGVLCEIVVGEWWVVIMLEMVKKMCGCGWCVLLECDVGIVVGFFDVLYVDIEFVGVVEVCV